MYNPDFWEISVDPQTLEELLSTPSQAETALLTADEKAELARKARLREQALQAINELIRHRLTARQRQVVELCYVQGLTQEEAASQLGVSQQVISKHLHGVMRSGKRVGGAMKKLGKLCAELGIDPEKWV